MIRAAMLSAYLVFGCASYAQSPQTQPLFADSAPLAVTLEGPFRELSRTKRHRRQLDGELEYVAPDGGSVRLDAKLRVRGNSRLSLCTHAPLRLNFRKKQVQGSVFAGQDKLKLVTLCKRSRSYEDYLALEYQIYRAFNVLTDASFRVRWLTVEYVETEARGSPYSAPAFLIESNKAVAERIGGELESIVTIPVDALDSRATTLAALFAFMVGNTDWSPRSAAGGEDCCHNTVPVQGEEGIVVVPYDFDQAGLINAEYAVPNPDLGIRSVRQRVYRGLCEMNDEVDAVIALLNERRAAIEAAFDAPPASERARRQALDFLEDSYEIVNDPRDRERQIIENCRA